MDPINQREVASSAREAAITSLAVVGFIALVAGGIWLAIYSTRFVPAAVDRIGAAAVYIGSVFTPSNDEGGLVVVDNGTATTTIPFEPTATTTDSGTPEPTTPGTGGAVQPGTPTETTVPVEGGAPTPGPLYGLPDLQVQIVATGYLTTSSASSFVESSEVPSGERPAVKFVVRNIGTNASGTWEFDAEIPTRRSFTYHSPRQQSLLPGESIEYTLGFDQAQRGEDQTITIVIDPDNDLNESNRANNDASATVEVN